MKKWVYAVGAVAAAFLLMLPKSVQAEEPEEILSSNVTSEADTGNKEKGRFKTDSSRADDWFSKQDDEKKARRQYKSKENTEKRRQADKKERYALLFKDNGFAYYLDTQNLKRMKIPYSGSEDILDVWIRLLKTDTSGEYSYPQKYYLEHYYLRPKKKQVQFLSELEVTGRPNNAIRERSYSVRNWENLVPGSLEDEIYNNVIKYMKSDPFTDWFKHKSFRDEVEDKLRISL